MDSTVSEDVGTTGMATTRLPEYGHFYNYFYHGMVIMFVIRMHPNLVFLWQKGRNLQAMSITGAGLSLRAGGRGFSPATKRVAPGYFYWKIEEK